MGLKLGQPLVGCSLSLCSIFIPVHLVGRINFGLKVLWVGCLFLSTGSPTWLQEVSPSAIIFLATRRQCESHPHILRGVSPVPEFCPRDAPINFPALVCPNSGHLIAILVPSSPSPIISSIHPPPMSILFPLLSEIQASSLGPSLLLSFFGSVDYSMVILFFMANIHL